MSQPCPQHQHTHRLIQQPLDELTDRLRLRSRKITGPRQAILDVLRKHASPLTNKEIHAALGKADCDLATIYRTMHTLEDLGLVKRFDFGDGAARFELVPDDQHSHHHHLVCTGCSMIVEVDDCFPSELEQRLAARHGFSGMSHRLEFFGICPKCRAATGGKTSPQEQLPH
jgi:Fur family transcriptional regulator, ferric uptake regulator